MSNDCSSIQAALPPVTLTVSTGKTPLSVAFAIANFPFSPTAFQPPNSLISITFPGATFFSLPSVFISFIFLLLSTTLGNLLNVFAKVSKSAFSAGALKTWFAEGSASVVSTSVRNGLLLSNAFPLRSSLEPEFAIELDSDAFSVFVAVTPTVAFPFVVSTAGASFFFSDFVCNFDVAVINFLYAAVNSVLVVAVLRSVLASSKTALRLLTLSSVLVA